MKMKNLIKVIVFVVFAMVANSSDCVAQSQVGNPTNAFWDSFNLPMKQVEPGVWAIYSGDINQDGTIDGLDMNYVEIDANNFAFGYNSSDLNGDGATDGLDMNILETNSNLFLFVARPQ
jgi:hypothetical protein